MSRAMRCVSLSAFAVVTLLFLIISCVSAPPNPYDPSNTKAYLTLESSSGLISADTLTDTVGNTIRVGITSNLPSDVDSIEVSVYNSADGNTDIDTMLKKMTPLLNQDTIWFKAAFTTSGKKTLTALVFAQGNNKNSTTAYISILDRPVKPAARPWPHISVTGTKNIATTQTCSLAVSVLDSNPAQAHTFYVKQDTQPQSEFTPPFKWTPPAGFTGASTVVFKVTDTDSPAYFDTATIIITVSAMIAGPKWTKDTVSLTQPAGSIISLTLGDICSGDSLSFSLAAQPVLNGETIINGVYTYTFAQGDTNTYWPKIIAKDKNGNADTMTLKIWATKPSASSAKALTAFSFTSPAVTGTITESSKTVALTVPNGTDVTALVATFTSTGASVKVGATVQTSATTANNFTSPLTYTVVAADGSTQAYVVTVTVAASSAKALTAFSFAALGVNGTITESAKTVALTVPYGTDVTALVATFTSTGASVKVGATVQTSATTANNFTSPVTYTMVAADGSPQNYVVTVTVAPSNAKALTAFSFVSPADTGTITGTSIAVTVPNGTTVTGLVANFTTTGASVKVGSVVQKSGTTANDFTNPVTYTVVAADGSPQNYAVTVTVAPSNAKALTAFSFAALGVTGTITESAKTVALTVPNGTDVTALVATFTSTGASVKVGATVQTSATTANNFTNAVTYTVVAADGSTQAYVVTVTVATSTAITITTQPQGQAKCLGSPVSFSVAATTATGTLSYQWKNASGNLTDAHYLNPTTNTLSINTITASDSGTYACVVTSTSGTSATSAGAKLTLNAATSITTQPSLQNRCIGASVSFTVAATGSGALTYQWQKGGANISGATAATYTISSVTSGDAANYTCVVTGGCGSVTSNAAALTINTAISITTQPSLQNICLGGPASFTVAATGSGALTYQWQKGGANISGATSPTYSIASVASGDAASYTCVATGGCGSVTSNAAALTINTATSITTQPSAQSVCIGGGASFTVVAAGSGTLTYQWQKGGASISGATSPTYSIASVASGDAASYTCVVTGGCGPVTSNAAALSVNAATTVIDPTSIIRTIGTSASFTVTGSGAGTLSYQWEKNGSNISGATTATYTIGSVASADQGSYSCTVTGSCGAVTSNAATLTIQCSVTYNGNGNTSGTAPGTTNDNYNTDIVISNSGTLAKSGLVFVNWNTAADGSGTYYNAGSTLSKIQNNIILYAQWDVRDADGNHYDTVRINGVTWMVQNLRTTKLSNGNSLANVTDGTTWSGLTTPAYCWINNDSNTYKNPYGALYNWYASSASTLAPNGWHIATEQEWGYLDSYVNGDASGLKATGTTYWASPNSGATNSTGFSALGGGSRTNTDGSFYNFSYIGYWWTSTPVGDGQNAYAYYMNCNSTGIAEFTSAIGNGYSVRCVKN